MSAQPAKSRTWIKIGVALVVVVIVAFVAFDHFRPTAMVVTVRRDTAVDVVTGSVVVHADKDLQEIKSEMPGRVVWIDPRQLGEPFKADEPIVKLDVSELERARKQAADDYNAQVERTKLKQKNDPALQMAKETLANAELQYKRNAMSEIDWKNAQRDYQKVETDLALADYDAQQAKIKFENDQAALQRQIDKMTIRAPSDGIVQAVMVAPGALINPGTTVATFFSNQRVVIAKVGEEYVAKVKVGQPAKVRLLNVGDQLFDATVQTILPFAEPETQRYSVYLQVKAPVSKLVPFSTGEATITVGERENVPVVPPRAILNNEYVLVVKNGVVEKRKISLGFKAFNLTEVTGNLKEGEQVIVDDLDQFHDGEHVRTVVAD